MSSRARIQSRELRRAREIAAQESRRRRRVLTGGGLVILGLVAAIVVSLAMAAGKSDAPSTAASAKAMVIPTSASANGSLTVGKADAPVRLEVYLDYLCPYCGRFERANGGEMNRLIADGTVRLELHPLAFLDRMSDGSRYSTRTANAIVTVADRAPDRLLAFNQALFVHQPEEGSQGLTNDEIANLAVTAGVPQDVVNLLSDGTYEPWIATATDAAFKGGVTGTPTVKINGVPFKGDLYTVGPLTQAITAAKAP
jgi:protein-disulfide isomerase